MWGPFFITCTNKTKNIVDVMGKLGVCRGPDPLLQPPRTTLGLDTCMYDLVCCSLFGLDLDLCYILGCDDNCL